MGEVCRCLGECRGLIDSGRAEWLRSLEFGGELGKWRRFLRLETGAVSFGSR